MKIAIVDTTEYHHNETKKIVDFFKNYYCSFDIEVDLIQLSNINFVQCTKCRCCTQIKGSCPVKCVIKDELNDILDRVEKADSYLIISDRKYLFSENKILNKFSKRLIAYYYWPYGQVQSTMRKQTLEKNAILINYNTTKYFMNHSFYTTKTYMEHTACSIGAKVLDSFFITPTENLIIENIERLKYMADKLLKPLTKKAS